MGGGKRAYETNGEGETWKGESIQNVKKEYRKRSALDAIIPPTRIAINKIINEEG